MKGIDFSKMPDVMSTSRTSAAIVGITPRKDDCEKRISDLENEVVNLKRTIDTQNADFLSSINKINNTISGLTQSVCNIPMKTAGSSMMGVRNVINNPSKKNLVVDYEACDKIYLSSADLKSLKMINFAAENIDLQRMLSPAGYEGLIRILKQYGYIYSATNKTVLPDDGTTSNKRPPLLDVVKHIESVNGQVLLEEVDFDYQNSPPLLVEMFCSLISKLDGKRVILDPYAGRGNLIDGLITCKIAKTNIFALDIHTNLVDSLKESVLPSSNVEKIDFLQYSKNSYDRNKINTILLFAPFTSQIWAKAIIHAFNILMNTGDVLMAVVPKCMLNHIETLEIPKQSDCKEFKDVFYICKNNFKQLTPIKSVKALFPTSIEHYNAGLITLVK